MMSRTAASRQHTQRDGQGVGGRASGASSREGILAIERAPSAPSDPALSMAEVACRPMSASHGLAGAVEGLRARGERRASRVGGCTYRAGQGDARTVEAEAPAGAKAGRAWRAARSTARDAKSASAGSTQSGLKRPFLLVQALYSRGRGASLRAPVRRGCSRFSARNSRYDDRYVEQVSESASPAPEETGSDRRRRASPRVRRLRRGARLRARARLQDPGRKK